MDNAKQKSDITKIPTKKSIGDYSTIVEEIKTYVDSLDDNESNYIFGNIAFSHDGEDKINIGSRLEYGDKSIETWKDLSLENKDFGAQLNAQQCFSITKYLKNKEIKILSLSFEEQWKELVLIPFDKNKKNKTIKYVDENDIQTEMFGEYKPCYYEDYPVPQGKDEQYAIIAFRKTLKYYNTFHRIVERHNPNIQKGYIYLIRPKTDLGGGFAALAYMFLKKSLDFKDLEIISQKLSLYFLDVLKKKAEIESIKSAIAAIMSRNMSHNLGSHYLYYTKTQLTSLADELGNKAPDIRGAAKVISYIQGRMDYLATIISNDKYPYGSVNFKSQIWDELTVDDFSKRHYSSSEPIQLSRIVYDDQLLDVRNLLKQTEKLNHTYDSIELANTSTSEDTISIGDDLKVQMEKITTKIGEMYGKISKGGANRRTTNFLLANLILSENYTRPSIIDAKLVDGKHSLQLYASLWNENTHQFELFTGTDNTDVSRGRTMMEEVEVKTQLSRLDLALPGGTMSCHAFFNIMENFIRNSAKYSWSKRCKHNDLIFTVALKVDKKNHTIEFTIYDNKRDAYKKRENQKLIHSLKSRLSSLVILGENNTVDKENKGLKEMLFSAVWLKANEFDESLAAIFSKIQLASNESKLELIKAYAFEFVSVDQNGLPCSDSRSANLGIRFTLPIFKRSEKLNNKKVQLNQLLRLHTDIIDILSTSDSKKNRVLERPYEQIFPRICYSDTSVLDVNQLKNMPVLDKTDIDVGLDILRLRYAIQKNLGCIDDYLLTMNGIDEPVINAKSPKDNHHIIRYDTHFSTILTIKQLRKEFYGKFAYVDTISGNNFSKTLEGMFRSGLVDKEGRRLYTSWNDMYLSLKIKEAALTHITIIDERLFNSVQWKVSSQGKVDIRKSAYELSMQNIRVLNFDDLDICKQTAKKKASSSLPQNPLVHVSEFPLLYGNAFLPIGPSASCPNGTHFLTIHLGLIEKILKSDRVNNICGEKGDNALSEERVLKFMNELKNIFSFPHRQLHICIHSGRGNYSSELAGPLKEYPFISLAALESSFNNSKYLLAQLFYNTVYIGKGEFNKGNEI